MTVFTWKQIEKIIEAQEDVPQLFAQGSAITVGNFDGMHIGHAVLFDLVRARAREHSLTPGVVTFSQSFASFKAHGAYSGDVSTLSQRLDFFEKNGMAFALVIDFSAEFGKIEGSAFLSALRDCCRMHYLAEGVDFRCGYGGLCGKKEIALFAQKNGIIAQFAEPVLYNELRVSSSRIRSLIGSGDFFTASKMLGRDYELDVSALSWEYCDSFMVCKKAHITQVLPPAGTYTVMVATSEALTRTQLYVEPCYLRLEASSKNVVRIVFVAH